MLITTNLMLLQRLIEHKVCTEADKWIKATAMREILWKDQTQEDPAIEFHRDWWIQNHTKKCFRLKSIKIQQEWVQEEEEKLSNSFMIRLLKDK